MAAYQQQLYISVAANDTEENEYTVPNGNKIYPFEMGGSGIYNQDVKVEIWWDTTLVFATHGDAVKRSCTCEFIGDGSKKLTIKLTNDTDQAETIGGYLLGEEYE